MNEIELVFMDGTLRLIAAPRGTRIVVKDYDHALCRGQQNVPFKADADGEPYEEYVMERPDGT